MGNVRNQLDESRVSRIEHPPQALTRFPQRADVGVVTQRQAGILGDLAEVVHPIAQSLDLVRGIACVRMASIGHLEEFAAELPKEKSVGPEPMVRGGEIERIEFHT